MTKFAEGLKKKNWTMYKQTRMYASKNLQGNKIQLETERAPDNLRCFMVVAARNTTPK